MTKTILITAAAFTALLHGQNSYLQTPAWMSARGPADAHATNRPDGQSGPVKGKPFSGTELRHSTQTLNDGSHLDRSDTSRVYRDAEGRMRDESDSHVLIYDPIARFTYEINVKDRTYRKYPVSDNATTSLAATSTGTSINSHSGDSTPEHNPHLATESLPIQSMSGLIVKGTRVTLTIPANTFGNDHELKVVNERWYSEDLGVLVKSSNSDPRFGNTSYELINIAQNAPDPALFQVPGDYSLLENRRVR